jgi:hypothetical protein
MLPLSRALAEAAAQLQRHVLSARLGSRRLVLRCAARRDATREASAFPAAMLPAACHSRSRGLCCCDGDRQLSAAQLPAQDDLLRSAPVLAPSCCAAAQCCCCRCRTLNGCQRHTSLHASCERERRPRERCAAQHRPCHQGAGARRRSVEGRQADVQHAGAACLAALGVQHGRRLGDDCRGSSAPRGQAQHRHRRSDVEPPVCFCERSLSHRRRLQLALRPSASDTRPSSATALQRADAGCTVRSPHDSTAAGARLCACAPCVALCCELGPRAEGWLVAFRRPTASALLNPERLAGTCAELSGCRHTCTAARALSSSPHIWPARLPVVAACLQAKAIIMRKRNRLPRCHRPALRLSLIGPTRRTRLYLTAAAPRGSIQARGPAPPVRASSAPQDHANPAAGSHARETPRVCFLRAQHPAWQSRHVVGPLPSRTPQGHPARENGRERASRVAAAGPTAPASAASAALISDKSAMAAVRDQARPLLPSLVLAARPDCWPAADLQQPSIGGAVI